MKLQFNQNNFCKIIIICILIGLIFLSGRYFEAICKIFKRIEWNFFIAIFTALAAFYAARSASISQKLFNEETKPIVVWNRIEPKISTSNDKYYEAYIKIKNYGKGLAYVKKVESTVTNINIYISTPITLGHNAEGQITLFFNKNYVDEIINQNKSFEGKFDHNEFKLIFNEGKIFALERKIAIDLYYWNTKKECFKTKMDYTVRLDVKNVEKKELEFQCFINNEELETDDKEFPPDVKHYVALL